ncbi:MAG: BMP family ABC transporter substrate-binding protein [Eubacteriales bacterium]
MFKSLIGFVIVTLTLILTGCHSTNLQVDTSESSSYQLPKDMKIALVVDEITDKNAFISQSTTKFSDLMDKYSFQGVVVEAGDMDKWESTIAALCEDDYDLIIGLGWQSGVAMPEYALAYEDISFVAIDASSTSSNVKLYSFDSYSGCYLLGVMVAQAFPDSDTFGYIGNYEDDANGVYLQGYKDGIAHVNSSATIITNYINSYTDSNLTYTYALRQSAKGATFIMGSASTEAHEGLFQAALALSSSESPLYVSSTSIDQTTSDNPYIIGGVTKNTGIAVEDAILEYISGTLDASEQEVLTLNSGGFGLVHVNVTANYVNTDIITPDVLLAVGDAYTLLEQ